MPKVAQEMAAAHEAENKRPDVVDKDLLMAATLKIEATAREHPGWSSVEATIADRKMRGQKEIPAKFDRNETPAKAPQERSARWYASEAEMHYEARVCAQARPLTHYAPPENLLKLHEQVTAKAAAHAGSSGRAHRFGSRKLPSGPSSTISSYSWDSHYNGFSEKPANNRSRMDNGARFDGHNLDLRFLDDEPPY
jgi:hypothetical protein